LGAGSCDTGVTSSELSSATTVCDLLFLGVEVSIGRIILFAVLDTGSKAKVS
jgi:hypothetical protein